MVINMMRTQKGQFCTDVEGALLYREHRCTGCPGGESNFDFMSWHTGVTGLIHKQAIENEKKKKTTKKTADLLQWYGRCRPIQKVLETH